MGPPPHPTAGEKGEGPPVAPPQWKWRCGNRLRDMYFYEPNGKMFRSRTELTTFLATMEDAPSADDFCWRVTPEILKTGVWNKEESSAKNKPSSPRTPSSNKRKAKTPVDEERKSKKAKHETGSNGTTQIPSPSTTTNGVQFSQVEPLAIRAPGSVVPKKVSGLTSRAKAKAKKGKSETPASKNEKAEAPAPPQTPKKEKAEPSAPPTFKEILREASSFKWLYDPVTLHRFLEDAGRLSERSAAEISEMRSLLVERNIQMGNITKYPNPVLRVFVRLLGVSGLGEYPPNHLGKVQLGDLCMKLAKPSETTLVN